MKLRVALLLMVVVVGSSLPFSLSGCGRQKESLDSADEAKKKARQVALDAPSKKKDDPKSEEPKQAAAGDFVLPDDPGGRLVSRVLAPPDFLPAVKGTKQPAKPAPRAIENPVVPLPLQVASLPRWNENGPRHPLVPHMIAPEPLFGVEESFGALPQVVSFPALDRVKIVTPDVAIPASLPLMAQPVADKVTTIDPTLDASKAAVLSEPLPERTATVPYQKLGLPDPFENQDAGKLTTTEPEKLPDGTISPPR